MDDPRDLFDRWLATRIESVQAQARPEAVPAFHVGGRPRRTTRVLGSSLAVVLVVVVAAVALITHQSTRNASPPPVVSSVVPWRALPAAQPVDPYTRPGILPCPASALSMTATGAPYIGSGPVNMVFWTVSIHNTGRATCFIGPALDVTFLTPSGPVHLSRSSTSLTTGHIVYLIPAGSPYVETTGQGDIDANCVPAGTRLEISPGPTLGSITIDPGRPGGAVPPCAHPTGVYWASIGECCTPGPQLPLPLAQAAVTAQVMFHPGERIRFLVTVTNRQETHSQTIAPPSPTPQPAIAMNPCPTYQEELEGVVGTAVTYTLNCDQAKPIPSNGKEHFEMFIDVPATAHPGPAVLAWRFTSPANLANVRSYIEIAP